MGSDAGSTPRLAPKRSGGLPAIVDRFGHHDLPGAEESSPNDHGEADRSGADDEHGVARRRAARSTAFRPTANGSTKAPAPAAREAGNAWVSRALTRTNSA